MDDNELDLPRQDEVPVPPRLGELLEIHHLFFEQSPPEDRLALEGETLEGLRRILARQGYAEPSPGVTLDDSTKEALLRFVAKENLEDRLDLKAGTIDRPAFEYLMRRFG